MRTATRRREAKGKFVQQDGELYYSVSASNASSLGQDGGADAAERLEKSAILPHEYQRAE